MKAEQTARQKRFGSLLRRERTSDKLSQAEVAQQRGCASSLISDYEVGERSLVVARVGEGGLHEHRAAAHLALESLPLDERVRVLSQAVADIANGNERREARLYALEEVREAVGEASAALRGPGLRAVRSSDSSTRLKAV